MKAPLPPPGEGAGFFIEEAELVVRMIEAAQQITRPPGMSAQQALDVATNAELVPIMQRAARAAVAFVVESMNAAKLN